MAKKKKAEEGGGNWMDTYGDLVTLLLTFFVLLYSMSTLDAKKWEIFVRSIGPSNASKTEEVAINAPIDGNAEQQEMSGTPELPEIEVEIDPDTLYLTLLEKLNELGITDVSVSRTENYTFVVFQDSPFFNGDSSVLTAQGKQVLDVLCQVLDGASSAVAQINIMGHTAQAEPSRPNRVRTDRMLSAMRAAEVCIYIQEKDIIEPEKLVCLSYGQHRPVAPFDTAENRALNRRVEILLFDKDAEIDNWNESYSDYSKNVNEGTSDTAAREGFSSADPLPENKASTMAPLQSETNGSAQSEAVLTEGEGETTARTDTVPAEGEAPIQTEAALAGSEAETSA